MTPEFRTALQDLHLQAGEFARLAGIHWTTVSRWDAEPPWAWALVRAWTQHPAALAGERGRVC